MFCASDAEAILAKSCAISRLANEILGALYRSPEPGFADWLQQIIDGAGFERFDGVLVKRGYDYDDRQTRATEVANHFEAFHPRHLQIEEYQVRPQLDDLLQDLGAIFGLAYYGHIGKQFQLFPQDPPRDLFIVGDDGLDRTIHLTLVYYRIPQKPTRN